MNKVALLFSGMFLVACGSSESHTVTIMSFNVENLFDNVDDPQKTDETYLALADKQSDDHVAGCETIPVQSWRDDCLFLDWSDVIIDHKLSVIGNTIKQVNGGSGPDIIAFQEIENAAILDRLRTEQLGDLAYAEPILIEGADNRGIDVAFLSRLPLVGDPTLHALEFPDHPDRQGDTRGHLEATFELPDGALLTGYAVHFPAPFHPTEMRVIAYERLNKLRAELPDDHIVFAAGDFNTPTREDKAEDMLDRFARPGWIVAHDLGCGDCEGTQYYARDDTWSFLDMIFVSFPSSEKTTWRIRADSVQIANKAPGQSKPDGTPNRYDAAEMSGVSDHWPMVLTLESTPNQ